MENQLTNFIIQKPSTAGNVEKTFGNGIDIKNEMRQEAFNIVNDNDNNLNIEKAHVKAHQRKTKSGKLVQVKEYEDSRHAEALEHAKEMMKHHEDLKEFHNKKANENFHAGMILAKDKKDSRKENDAYDYHQSLAFKHDDLYNSYQNLVSKLEYHGKDISDKQKALKELDNESESESPKEENNFNEKDYKISYNNPKETGHIYNIVTATRKKDKVMFTHYQHPENKEDYGNEYYSGGNYSGEEKIASYSRSYKQGKGAPKNYKPIYDMLKKKHDEYYNKENLKKSISSDLLYFEKAEFDTESRKKLAKKKEALPDGSFPIRNTNDLKNAIHDLGRAKSYGLAKRWIIKRAKALGVVDLLPEKWNVKKSNSNNVNEEKDELKKGNKGTGSTNRVRSISDSGIYW